MDRQIFRKAHYVKLSDGTWLVQVTDPDARWGFYLCDEDQSWDGGFGIADNQEWTIVQDTKVPKSVKARLGWIIEEHA